MTRSTILRLFVGSLIAAVLGGALFTVAAAVGFGNEVLIMNGPDVVGLRPGALSATMIVTAGVALLLWTGATVAIVVAWVGAIINTANLTSKSWLVIELVIGLLGLPLVAVLVYLVGRPEENAYQHGPMEPGPSAVPQRNIGEVNGGR